MSLFERKYWDPHVASFFEIEIDGLLSGSFQEVSGLGGSTEVFEIKEGGLNCHSHKFVTRATYGDITLKRGFWNNFELFGWFEVAARETWTPRKSGSIIMKDDGDSEVCRWDFIRAFPVKWDGPALNAASGIAMESCTLSCEWLRLAKVKHVSPW